MRTLLLSAVLLLAAGCGSDTSDDLTRSAADGTSSAGGAATAPEASATEGTASGSGADCLVGTWQIDPSSMDPDKVQGIQQIPNAEFSVSGSTGRALLTFEASGDAVQTFEAFSVTIDAAVMGQTVSVRNNYSGIARATYTVEDGRIVMEPGDAELTTSVSVNGGAAEPNPFATESVFEEMERGRTGFECDGDDLTFDIYSPDSDGGDVFVRDIRYTRVAG